MTRGTRVAFATLAVAVVVVPAVAAPPVSAAKKPPAVFECLGTPAERPVLTTGSTGSCVGFLESFLRNTYDPKANRTLYPDTRYSQRTFMAVVRFQRDYKSTDPRGVVGAATWQIIDDLVAIAGRGAAFASRYPNLHMYGASHTHFSRPILLRMLHAAGIKARQLSGLSGTATVYGKRNALERLRHRVKVGDIPDLIIVATGVNDLGMAKRVDPSIPTLTDPAEIDVAYQRVYTGWIRTFMDYVDTLPGTPDVLWLTVAKYDPTLTRDESFNAALHAEQVRRAELADPALATLTLIDTAASMNAHPEWYVSDGTHLTVEGYRARSRCTVDALLVFETFGNETVIPCPT